MIVCPPASARLGVFPQRRSIICNSIPFNSIQISIQIYFIALYSTILYSNVLSGVAKGGVKTPLAARPKIFVTVFNTFLKFSDAIMGSTPYPLGCPGPKRITVNSINCKVTTFSG